jgi:hypothetical protein
MFPGNYGSVSLLQFVLNFIVGWAIKVSGSQIDPEPNAPGEDIGQGVPWMNFPV